jgi:hypothetical protein
LLDLKREISMRNLMLIPAAFLVLAVSASAQMTIPSGTDLVVRTNETIDSKNANANRVYSAVVHRDIRDSSGAVAIPKGSSADLVVRRLSSGSSNNEMALDLQSITVNGQRYTVNATDVEKSTRKDGLGKNKRTGEMVGGGAVLGTIIGAIAGGGKGAAIGAIAGGAAGAGTEVLTRGKEVKVPAETVLTFPLSAPLQLNR